MRRIVSLVACTAACLATVSIAGGSAPRMATAQVRGVSGAGLDLVAPTRPGIARRNTGTGVDSYNWSGYVQAASKRHTFTGVTATLMVPTVDTSIPGSQHAADWVGIGGFGNGRLVQAGVEEDSLNGRAFYQAWTEVLPRSEVRLSLAISPGDRVTITVRETANHRDRDKKWSMTVSDTTTGLSAGRTTSYRGWGTSAEAIHERPCLGLPCSNHLATLATTTNATFDPSYFTTSAPNVAPTYLPLLAPTTGAALFDIAMVPINATETTPAIATPSNANSHDDGFTVADGGSAPAPPS
jgi:hypothetical protein